MLEILTHREEALRKCSLKQGATGQGGGARARFVHGQEAAVLEAGLAKEVRELPKLQAGTHLPIMIPELLALILWERSTSKPESYELKCWLIELIIVQSSEFSHNEPEFSWKPSLGQEALMMKQLFTSQTQSSSLGPGILAGAPCSLSPSGSTPGFLKAEAGSVDTEIVKMVGARFPSLEKDLTSVSGCHDGILFIFNFIPDLKLLE